MFREEKNLKDSQKDLIKDTSSMPVQYGFSAIVSYTKTNKLITALYMVTDVIEKDEPLRNKLRTLGTGIISDMNSVPTNACVKISEIISFLDIALTMNIMSEMNFNILRKEFSQLDKAIKESFGDVENNKKINLSEFLGEDENKGHYENSSAHFSISKRSNIGQYSSTSIGVQKGSTLLKALSGISSSSKSVSDNKINTPKTENFDQLKKQRRNEISSLIKKSSSGVTITDIKNDAYGSLVSCSEKTLQRELISMVKDGVLNKTGEKRWSKYFLK